MQRPRTPRGGSSTLTPTLRWTIPWAARPDLMVAALSERLIVEVKLVRGREFQRRIREALLQVSGYLTFGGINQTVLFSYLSPNNVQCRGGRRP